MLRLVIYLASAAFYLGCLVAVHLSIALLPLLIGRRAALPPASIRVRARLVGAGTALVWTLALTALFVLLGGSPDGFWLGLAVALPPAAVVGWQVAVCCEARLWALSPGAVSLGSWRDRAFFVSRPQVVAAQERLKHMAVSGPTGSGKSTLLRNLILADIHQGVGLCAIDPKDDLIDGILGLIPKHREQDIVLFDVADVDFPLGFNPLHGVPAERRSLATGELVAVFRRYFADSWGVRLEHILTNVILALLETPQTTLLDIPRLLLEPSFGQWVLGHVSNPGVRQFFQLEYEAMLRHRGDALQPILNKVGPWLAYPELRNVVGQVRSSFDLRRVMDEGKVLLVRTPQGALGESVSSLLNAFLVAKIQLAAHSRADTPPERRRRFVLYCDEFQNYDTSSFERIIVEARAFGLGLVCSNQYPEQLSRQLQLALARNVATSVQCLYERGRYRLQVSRLEDVGREIPPRIVVPPPPLPVGDPGRAERIRALSRARYGRPRQEVEREIMQRSLAQREAESEITPRPLAQRGARGPRQAASRRVDVEEE